jgi:drug/metabolite transporter (DMT)-like permease
MIFYFGIVSSLVALIPALYVWQTPGIAQLLLLMLVGCFGAAGQYCVVRGYRVGEATALIPFDYARLLFAAVIGILLFAEIPDIWTLTGAAVIVGATLYIALREVKVGKQTNEKKPD